MSSNFFTAMETVLAIYNEMVVGYARRNDPIPWVDFESDTFTFDGRMVKVDDARTYRKLLLALIPDLRLDYGRSLLESVYYTVTGKELPKYTTVLNVTFVRAKSIYEQRGRRVPMGVDPDQLMISIVTRHHQDIPETYYYTQTGLSFETNRFVLHAF